MNLLEPEFSNYYKEHRGNCFKCHNFSLIKHQNVYMCFECGYIADQVQMTMDWGCGTYLEVIGEQGPYRAAVEKLQDLAHQNLLYGENRKPLSYLMDERGLTMKTIRKYKLGYADTYDDDQFGFIRDSQEILREMRYLTLNYKGEEIFVYDDKIVFPVYSLIDTQLIGLASRSYKDKFFIHNPNGPIYAKSKVLYGKISPERMRQVRAVYVVEGMFDLHTLESNVDLPVVGLLGGKTSNGFLALYRYGVKKLIIATDGDEAGDAAFEALKTKWEPLFLIERLPIPRGMDPDEYYRRKV